MDVIYRKIESLSKLENNPRTITPEDMERLKESISNNPDYLEAHPIVLSDRTGELVIIDGNQRYEACVQLGMNEVPTALLHGLTEEREQEIIIRANVLNGKWDIDKLLSCAALCKKDGMIFYSGIPLRFAVRVSDRSKSKDYRSKAIFLDAHNFTANYRFGEWYYQHYHSTADVIELNQTYIGNNFKLYDKAQPITPERELSGSSFQVVAINEKIASKDDYISALRYEFSLPLPNNRRWDLDKEIIPVFEAL